MKKLLPLLICIPAISFAVEPLNENITNSISNTTSNTISNTISNRSDVTFNNKPHVVKQNMDSKNYHITVYDNNKVILDQFDFIFPNKKTMINLSQEHTYSDLCIKTGDKIDYSQKKIQSKAIIDLSGKISDETSLLLTVNFSALTKINLGDCFIESPSKQQFIINTPLPFVSIEQNYHLLDENGKELPEVYSLEIQSKKN